MGFFEAVKFNFTHYADFKGRAPRSQYWWWAVFLWIVYGILNVLDSALALHVGPPTEFPMGDGQTVSIAANGVLSSIWGLVVLLPSIAVAVRRLHDRDKSGWWILLNLICCIGQIILFIWYVMPGTRGPNRFGEDPLGEVVI